MRKFILFSTYALMVATVIYSCQSASDIELASYIGNGKDLYVKYCQTCHGEKGEGLGELAPPLTDTVYLKQNKAELACSIKNGVNKPIVINGKTYEGQMPAFPELENIDIAQVIVYITNSFGNKQGMYKHQLVEKDLMKCNEAKQLKN